MFYMKIHQQVANWVAAETLHIVHGTRLVIRPPSLYELIDDATASLTQNNRHHARFAESLPIIPGAIDAVSWTTEHVLGLRSDHK